MGQRRIHIFSGIGLGLLIGICIGLSSSPVVAIVLTTLTSLLAAYFGLKPASEQIEQKSERLLIMIAFSFTCVTAILGSVYIRANGLLSPPTGKLIGELRELGFSQEEARTIFLYKEYGIVPPGSLVAKDPVSMQDEKRSILYNAEAQRRSFEALQRDNYGSIEDQLTAFRNRKGKYQQYTDTLTHFVKDSKAQAAIIQATLNLFQNE
ncbi:hypothetical protein [Dawidia soli]|uniref:Uncharacterized protein n=1 Tax=Dawidia soli TaxID=2782352 RepID=A0AAP2D9W3_9BACT|nr:hypothetical protein [Dawidia soli]MBT1688113.1 hypothetical protein [Dawidia soli]